tara:strand:+ start:73 stop:1791 length:1719 start_codon:yes stop_codon:yes gene_type:complete
MKGELMGIASITVIIKQENIQEIYVPYTYTSVSTNTKKTQMNKGQKAITEFIKSFRTEFSLKNDLLINLSHFKAFDQELVFKQTETKENELKRVANKFDFIFGDFPFGMNRIENELIPKTRINQNWNSLYESLKLLDKNGFGLFVIEPSVIYSKQGTDFLNALEEQNYFHNFVLDIPEKIYEPHTSFQPIIIGFSKKKYEKLFISKLEYENVQNVVLNFKNQQGTEIDNGIWIEKDSFQSFSKYNILSQIGNLKTQYKEYKDYQLSEISSAINMTREEFNDEPNTLYIPKIGNSAVVSSLTKLKIKPQNYFQVVLNPEIVFADYLALFYKSEIGQLILNSLNTGSFIPAINKNSIQESIVAIPKLEEQKLLIHTNSKLNELQKIIDDLQLELSLNPKNATVILEKFDTIQSPLKSLSIEDEILSLIRKGEGKKIEFKQTFSKNIHTNKKDTVIEKSALKNIVGFLNAEGGTLLIGIADNSDVTGIEDDFFKSKDKYLLNFKNAINTKIGSEFYPLIEYDIVNVWDKNILKIDCKKSTEPCFYDDKEFFVRTNPATDRLEGKKQREYIKRRFD